MSELNTVLSEIWVQGVIVFGLLAMVAVFAFGAIWKRLGNAGGAGKCVACGAPASMAIPQIGLSFADRLFSPNGKPCEPRLIHDFGDERRLCQRHHDERALELQKELSQHNADTRKTSAASYKGLRDRADASLLAMLPKSADATPEPTKVTQPSVPGAASAFGATP